MNMCYNCNGELLWNSDYDISEENDAGYIILTILTCKKCDALVEYYIKDFNTIQ